MVTEKVARHIPADAFAMGADPEMSLLGLDIGTTHCKAAIFDEAGKTLATATLPSPRSTIAGATVYTVEHLWETVRAVSAACCTALPEGTVTAIGIASMAETGLLLDPASGAARTPFLPWFDTAAARAAQHLVDNLAEGEALARFGLQPTFKCGLAKLLHLGTVEPRLLDGARWLSVADYVAFRLTGVLATDETLAGRTCAFNLASRAWDHEWLARFDLTTALFPPVSPSGTPIGVTGSGAREAGLSAGIPVAIGGHDHLCALIGAGAGTPGQALDSMGTAEVLTGACELGPLGALARRTGLAFGIMPLTGTLYWLGGLSSAGGALDWLRGILGTPPLSYAELAALQATLSPEPGEPLFLPYLAGSGAPLPNPASRGAFIGLAAEHGRADLLKAVLEGTAYQLEAIRRAATSLTGKPPESITVTGGGTRNPRWIQIKADVYGVPLDVRTGDEAALLGAALIAGVGCGRYPDAATALACAAARPCERVEPDPERHRRYADRFDRHYLPWQGRLVSEV